MSSTTAVVDKGYRGVEGVRILRSGQKRGITLQHYLATYNHHIPQRALNHQSPVQALQAWQQKKPELFLKWVYKQAGLDNAARR